jgi:hypothetical protein
MDNLEELLLPPTDAAAYMQNLMVDIQDIDELSPYEGHARLTIRW